MVPFDISGNADLRQDSEEDMWDVNIAGTKKYQKNTIWLFNIAMETPL